MMKNKEEEEEEEEEIVDECQICQLDFAVKGCWNCNLLLCESCSFSHKLPRRRRRDRIVEARELLRQREKDKKFRKRLREEHQKARDEAEKEALRLEEERKRALMILKSKTSSSSSGKESSKHRNQMIRQINFPSGQRYEGNTRAMNNVHKPYLPHGKGRLYRKSGKLMYEGGFKEGKRHGQGEHVWKEGSKWIGTFRDDAKYGFGQYVPSRRSNTRKLRRNSFYFDDELICEENKMQHGTQLMLKCDRGVWKPATLIRKTTRKQQPQQQKQESSEQYYKVLIQDELEPRVLDLQRVRFRFQKDVPRAIRLPTCHGAISPVKRHTSTKKKNRSNNNNNSNTFFSNTFSKGLMCSPKMRRMRNRAHAILSHNDDNKIDMYNPHSSNLPKLYGCLSPMSPLSPTI